MFIKHVSLDQDSMIEISTRLIAGETRVILSIRGKKNDQEVTVTSAALDAKESELLAQYLKEAAIYKTSIE